MFVVIEYSWDSFDGPERSVYRVFGPFTEEQADAFKDSQNCRNVFEIEKLEQEN